MAHSCLYPHIYNKFDAIPNIYHKLCEGSSVHTGMRKKKTEKGSFLIFLVFRHGFGVKKKKIQQNIILMFFSFFFF